MSVLVITLVMVLVRREVEGQSAELLASVIEFSDYPEEDSDLMKRLDNGVPVNVIQRPDTGLNANRRIKVHTCKKRVMLRRRLFWPKKNCGKSA